MGDRQTPEPELDLSPLAEKVMRAMVVGRWLLVIFLWLTFGVYGLWSLRADLPLWRDYFTWAIFRYSLAYHYGAAVSLVTCLAYTCAVLVWRSQKLLKGYSAREKYRLEQDAAKIAKNPRHWLWLIINRL